MYVFVFLLTSRLLTFPPNITPRLMSSAAILLLIARVWASWRREARTPGMLRFWVPSSSELIDALVIGKGNGAPTGHVITMGDMNYRIEMEPEDVFLLSPCRVHRSLIWSSKLVVMAIIRLITSYSTTISCLPVLPMALLSLASKKSPIPTSLLPTRELYISSISPHLLDWRCW